MKPYWITTNQPMTLGYGITAHSAEDAETLLRLVVPAEYAINDIIWVRDVRSLDQGHVVPNMGNLLKRGIWFPLGHDHLAG
ncbi:hypothetical protein [Sphingomonas mali]|uniref:hypothetical protein n=1 Tax=Sphingomonas mali TaxID=40682 RepID=UPI0008324555|nr:hypothetical protein [Sphingomonas mali]